MVPKDIVNLMAFDFGLKQMGVAVGQTITNTARPIDVVAVKAGNADWDKVDALVDDWGPDAFVLGLSLHMNGAKQSFHPQLEFFKKELSRRYKKEVFWSDERLTTVAAREQLFDDGGKRKLTKANIDAKSAEIILEQWLYDNNCS